MQVTCEGEMPPGECGIRLQMLVKQRRAAVNRDYEFRARSRLCGISVIDVAAINLCHVWHRLWQYAIRNENQAMKSRA